MPPNKLNDDKPLCFSFNCAEVSYELGNFICYSILKENVSNLIPGEDEFSKIVLTINGDPDPLKRTLLKAWLHKKEEQEEEAQINNYSEDYNSYQYQNKGNYKGKKYHQLGQGEQEKEEEDGLSSVLNVY